MSETYIASRKTNLSSLNPTYRPRPHGVLFADSQGSVVNSYFTPIGAEFDNFIVLTDDNRKEIDVSVERIEQRKRMINGRMRSYHVADKIKLGLKWDMIPSRAFAEDGRVAIEDLGEGEYQWNPTLLSSRYTTDGGAAGGEMLDWYNNNQGSFWIFLAYDRYTTLQSTLNAEEIEGFDEYMQLGKYNERIEMYFADFSYNIVKRGPLFDYWNVSMSLEEA